MSCADVRQQLLEGDPTPSAAVRDHLAGCAGCRRLAEAVGDADDQLHDGLAAVLDRPLSVPVPRRRMSMTVPALIVAAAASLTLALAPVLPDFGTSSGAPDLAVLEGTAAIPAEALSATDWADRRDRLHRLWTDHGEALSVDERFGLAVQLGRAAALASEPVAPFFDRGDNVFYGEARALDAAEGGRLVAAMGDPDLAAAVSGRRPSDATVRVFMEEVDAVSTIPWNALSEGDWALRRDRLAEGFRAHRDRLSQQQLMLALAQLGRAVENANVVEPAYFPEVDGRPVNGPWHAAAGLEVAQPGLLADVVTDAAVVATVGAYVERIQSGELSVLSYRELFEDTRP